MLLVKRNTIHVIFVIFLEMSQSSEFGNWLKHTSYCERLTRPTSVHSPCKDWFGDIQLSLHSLIFLCTVQSGVLRHTVTYCPLLKLKKCIWYPFLQLTKRYLCVMFFLVFLLFVCYVFIMFFAFVCVCVLCV